MFRLAFLLVVLLGGAASAERRLAFVVGNDAYTEVPRLLKAVNDAEAVAATLAGQGFEVTLVRDADRREMNRSLSNFTGRLGAGDTAFVFFAGHGVEISGENYLLPVDIVAPASGDGDFVASESIALSQVLDRIRATGARATIAVIDACRDNPFETTTGRSIGGTRGLGRIAAPEGTFVIFSAGAGQMALDRLSDDDPDPNSVFTRALLPQLSRPGLELRDLVNATRLEVRDLARGLNHAQFPAYYDELLGPFYLIPAPPGAGPARDEPDPVAEDFALARDIGTPQALQTFLDLHGSRDGDFRVALARRMLEEAEGGPPQADTAANRAAEADPDAPTGGESTIRSETEIVQEVLDSDGATAFRTEIEGSRTLAKDDIAVLQRRLNDLGCDAGTDDGIAGRRTRAGFARFLAANPASDLSPDAATEARALAAVTAPDAARCVAVAASAPVATTPPAARTLAGTWRFTALCPLAVATTGTMRAAASSGGTFRTEVTDSLGQSATGTAMLEGRSISGRWNWGLVRTRWTATLSSDGQSYSGADTVGCSFAANRVR